MFPLLPPYPAAEGLAARFAFILQAVRVYVASRVRQTVPGFGEFLIPLRFEALINDWLQRRRAAIVALIGRIEAGTQRPPRPYKPRETKTDPTCPGTQRKAAVFRPPTLGGWLCVLGREVRFPGLWLTKLLEETEARAMVIAHPQLARLIRPVLRMLGEQAPAWMPTPPKRRRPTRPARKTGRPEPAAEGAVNDATRDLASYTEAVRARQYAANMATLYAGCGGSPGPSPAIRPSPPSAAAAPLADEPASKDRYVYAVRWNGEIIPVRRRWGW